MGSHDPNIFLNTLNYDVELPDGEIKEQLANVIDENIHAQVDEYGHAMQIMDAIVRHRKHSNTVDKADAHLRTKSRHKFLGGLY